KHSNSSQSLNNKICVISQEILKFLMGQISSLKRLIHLNIMLLEQNVTFISYPEAKDCLKDLIELRCNSDAPPEFFYQLSKICHNIQVLYVIFKENVSNGIAD